MSRNIIEGKYVGKSRGKHWRASELPCRAVSSRHASVMRLVHYFVLDKGAYGEYMKGLK